MGQGRRLLVDTCGERGSVALALDGRVVAEVRLAERAASTGLLGAIREVLAAGRVSLPEIEGVGVVSGPGSFTGVRVGLAVVKGLCEALGTPMAAVSRLEVLAETAGLRDGFAVLGAGREQVYVREETAGAGRAEWMATVDEVVSRDGAREVVCAEEALGNVLRQRGVGVRVVALRAGDALGAVERVFKSGGSDVALTDANYVRDEAAIYRRAQGVR